MVLDIRTLAYVSCLTFFTQFVALFVQYCVNRAYRGIKWWLMGSTIWAVGVIFMPMVTIKSLIVLAMIANPLTVIGQIFLYIGVVRFLNKKENWRVLTSIYILFIGFYYYFIFFDNNLSARAFVLVVTFAVVSFMTAYTIFVHKYHQISWSANFTAFVFWAYGCFSTMRAILVSISPPIQSYTDPGLILGVSFIIPMITSLLWTFGFIIMMNQHLHAAIREEKENLQMIFNTSPDAALISRLTDGLIVDINAGFSEMSGYSRAELIGNTTIEINIWHNAADREKFINELTEIGHCEKMEFVFQQKDGSLLTGSVSAKIISIQLVPHIYSVVLDITKSKLAAAALRESEELYRSILNASPDDITITDLKGCIQVISPAARNMFGYDPEYDQFLGSHVIEYIVPGDRDRARTNIFSMINGQYTGPNEYHAVRQDGSLFNIEVNSGIIHDASGQPAKMVFIIRDITERKQAEQLIQELVQQLEREKEAAEFNANTDSLTGLANRRSFDEMLTKEFQRLKRSGNPLSLILLDVDQFKKFNDRYGHLAGDHCLRQIAAALRTLVRRSSDFVARYGGEEFVVILTETDQNGAVILAERIRKNVEMLGIPHSESDTAECVTVSLGVATISPGTRLATAEQVVALADDALYCAKNEGRNRTSVTDENAVAGSRKFV